MYLNHVWTLFRSIRLQEQFTEAWNHLCMVVKLNTAISHLCHVEFSSIHMQTHTHSSKDASGEVFALIADVILNTVCLYDDQFLHYTSKTPT